MPALAMADLKAVLPQAAMHNHDRNVRLEHLRRDDRISHRVTGKKVVLW